MSRTTHVILKHYSSRAEHPKYDDRPEGAKSWGSYQRDIALGTNNHKCIQNPLPPAVEECIQPVFERLGKLLMNYIFCFICGDIFFHSEILKFWPCVKK